MVLLSICEKGGPLLVNTGLRWNRNKQRTRQRVMIDLFDDRDTMNLCIIGNGFDIHHDLEAQYSDFREYLIHHGKMDYVMQLESFFQTEYKDKKGKRQFLLWSNLEAAIGNYDLEALYHELTDWIEIDEDHMMQTAAQIEDSPNDFLAPVVDDLPDLMKEWISSINLYGVETDVVFPKPSRFLSFNYTRLLENAYHIPEESILHIHGVIGGPDKLDVGHRVKANESDAYDENAPIYQEDSKINIIRIMNKCRKPTEDIIARNWHFFQSLHDITDVYVYGHSYSMVDKDYYEEIQKNVSTDTKWHLGCHNEVDRDAAELLMHELGVRLENWGRFEF